MSQYTVAALCMQTIVLSHHCAQKHSGKMGNRNKCSNFKVLKLWHFVKILGNLLSRYPWNKNRPFCLLALHSVSSDSNSLKIKLPLSQHYTTLPWLPTPPLLQSFLLYRLVIVCICADVMTIPRSQRENRGIVKWKWKEK